MCTLVYIRRALIIHPVISKILQAITCFNERKRKRQDAKRLSYAIRGKTPLLRLTGLQLRVTVEFNLVLVRLSLFLILIFIHTFI